MTVMKRRSRHTAATAPPRPSRGGWRQTAFLGTRFLSGHWDSRRALKASASRFLFRLKRLTREPCTVQQLCLADRTTQLQRRFCPKETSTQAKTQHGRRVCLVVALVEIREILTPPPAGYPFANSSSRSPGTVSTRRHPGENGIHLTRKPQQLLEGAFPQPLPPPPLDAAGSSRYLPGPLKNEAAQTAGLSAEAPQRPPGTFPCPVGPAQSLGSSASDCYRQNGTDVEPLRADAWLWRATEDHSAFRHEPSQISQSGWPGSALLGPPLKHIGPDNGFRCLGGRDSSTAAHDLSQQHRLYLHAGGDAEQSTSSRKASTAELYPSGADPFGDIWALLDDSPGPASSEPGCGGPGSGCAVTAQMKLEPSQAAPAGSEVLPEGEGPPCSKRAERPGTHVSREPLSESASERRQQPSQPFEGSCPAACSGNVGGEGLSQCADRAVDLDDPRVSRRDYLRGASLAPGARGTSSHRSVSGCPTVSSSVDCTAATRPNSDCRYFATSSISLGGGATNSSAAEGVPCSHSSSCNKGAVATVVDSYALVSSAGLRGLSPGRHLEPSLHIAKGKASAACVYSGGNDHDMQQARGREMQREVFPRALPCSGLWNGEQGFPTLAGDNSETGSAACCSPSHSNSSYNSSYSTSLGTSRNGSSDTAHNDCNRSSHSPPWGNIGGRSNEHPGAAVPSEESTDAELMRLTELFLHLSTSTSTCGSSAAAVADTDARQAQRPHEGAAAST